MVGFFPSLWREIRCSNYYFFLHPWLPQNYEASESVLPIRYCRYIVCIEPQLIAQNRPYRRHQFLDRQIYQVTQRLNNPVPQAA